METLESLRRQIEAAEDLRSVAKTMKGMAAVSVRRFQVAAESLATYLDTVDLGFRILVRDHPQLLAGLEPDPDGPVAAVVLGTEQGLCGSVNREVAALTADRLRRVPVGDRLVLALGRRVAPELESRGVPVTATGTMPGTVEGITTAVQSTLVALHQWRDERGVGRVVLVHHRPVGRAGHAPRVVRLIPVDAARIRRTARDPWPTRVLPSYSVPPAALLASLVEEAVFGDLVRAFADALASEHVARLVTMQNAERNIEERLEDLGGRLHQLRQASITQELLEVVAGFEVLEDEDRRTRPPERASPQ